MSRFLATASQLLDAAIASQAAAQTATGHEPAGPQGQMTLLVDAGGGLTLLKSDWPLEALERERGAREVYRVHDRAGRLFVEGRAGAKACLLSAAPPEQAARTLRHFQSPVELLPAAHPFTESSSCGPKRLL